jgi:membrane protein YqaA with SNARE-associated domain
VWIGGRGIGGLFGWWVDRGIDRQIDRETEMAKAGIGTLAAGRRLGVWSPLLPAVPRPPVCSPRV